VKTRDPLLVLQDALKDMEKTAIWLRQSWDRCRIIPAAQAASEANAEAVEAFMSRFARTVDLLANKVLRYARSISWNLSPRDRCWTF